MPLINWSENYSVSVKEIDSQHKKLVDLINNLHEGMKHGKGKEILGGVLNELVNYTAYHFSFEEKLFDKYLYPETIHHKREHQKLVEKVKSFANDFNNGRTTVSVDVMNFLKDWLINHIQGTDKKYSSFLNNKGVA